jgi:hypothetical protein
MEEIILQEVIGKITDQDKQLQAVQTELRALPDHAPALQQMQQQIEGLRAEVEDIPKRISLPEQALNNLGRDIRRHADLLKGPIQQEVRHHHHVVKIFWIAAGLLVCCLVLVVLLVNARDNTSRHEAADVEYRYLRISGGRGLAKVLDNADSVYIADPGKMEEFVEEQERVRREEAERLRILEEKRKEVRELEAAGK